MTVEEWVEAYGRAWRERDADSAVELFTEDAEYRFSPFREPVVGSQAIHAYWEDVTSAQEELDVRMGTRSSPATSSPPSGGRRWSKTARRPRSRAACSSASPPDGRCTALREYWFQKPGRCDPHRLGRVATSPRPRPGAATTTCRHGHPCQARRVVGRREQIILAPAYGAGRTAVAGNDLEAFLQRRRQSSVGSKAAHGGLGFVASHAQGEDAALQSSPRAPDARLALEPAAFAPRVSGRGAKTSRRASAGTEPKGGSQCHAPSRR